ncbi:hypothetical protein U1Q18_007458 [Sarracenia purpurea var. burkii]
MSSRNCGDAYPSSVSCTRKLITTTMEVAFFPSTLLQEGSSVEVLRLHGHQRIWIEGILDCLNGAKAHVVFPETDGNGELQIDAWVPGNARNLETYILKDQVSNSI